MAKLNLTGTGDTLGCKDKPIKIVPPAFPEPIFSKAVYPKTKLDLDKLGPALTRIVEEDPTLGCAVKRIPLETIMSGIGETQLEVAAEKMQRKFGVSVNLETPKVPYKETITVPAKAEFKHKKQTGGHGQYGHVLLELSRCRAAAAWSSRTGSSGGPFPRTTSRPWKRASTKPSRKACWPAIRSPMCSDRL